MKSVNRFRIIEEYDSWRGTYYIVQELYQNRNGIRSQWRTWKRYIHEAAFDATYSKLEDAQDNIKRRIQKLHFTPRIVSQIDAVAIDPDYAAALEELEKEGIGIPIRQEECRG